MNNKNSWYVEQMFEIGIIWQWLQVIVSTVNNIDVRLDSQS